ncbi:efflux transporter outer membrane subunit [Pseudomonas sp.]|uniref:efflux transporter outer membrane subunit n=1 Tax=Pseudomonas sp. TaxID=306 RepID=UPI00272CAC07|nr:efflux transporter outer membrane subunit [Pseudomonas sp.]
MPTRKLVPLLVLAALTGCASLASSPAPDRSVPADWTVNRQSAPVPDASWWHSYQSAELNQLIERARGDNLDLAAAAARLLQADAQVRQSGAALLPQLGATLGGSRQDSQRLDADGNASRSSFNAGLSAAYEIDFWGRNRAAMSAAEAGLLAAGFDRDTLILSTDAAVANSWFQLLEVRERLDLAQRSLTIAERVLELVEARQRFGAADALELSQQRTLVAQLRSALPELQQAELQLSNALRVLLGAMPDSELPSARLADIEVPTIGAGLPADLLTRRPDIAASEARLLAANADLTAARAALFPSIQLTGQYGMQSLALSGLLSDPVTAWTLAAGLTQPIFQGGRLRAQVDLSEARQQELLVDYRRSVVAALADTDTALGAARQTGETYQFLDEANQQAERAFRLAEVRYREGAITLQTLLDAQRTWYQSRDTLARQRSAQLQASVALYRALGGGWSGSAVSY